MYTVVLFYKIINLEGVFCKYKNLYTNKGTIFKN